MLCRSLARPRRGGEEERWHWGHWGRSVCSPSQPVSSSHPNPGEVDLFWIRKSHKNLIREHGKKPSTAGTTRLGAALPAWPSLPGATCTFPATSCTYKIPNAATPRLLSLYSGCAGSELGWEGAGLGLYPSTALPQPVEP